MKITRTQVAGGSMLLGGVLLMVPPLLGPPNGSDSTRERLAYLVNHRGVAEAKSLLFQAAVLFILPGVCAVIGRTHGRGAVGVLSGGAVYVAGLVGAFSFALMEGLDSALAGEGPVPQSVADASDRMGSSPVAIPTFVLALLLFHLIGWPWLTLAMRRARQVSWWVVGVGTAGTLCAFFGSGTPVERVGWLALGVSVALVARTLLLRPVVAAEMTRHSLAPAPA